MITINKSLKRIHKKSLKRIRKKSLKRIRKKSLKRIHKKFIGGQLIMEDDYLSIWPTLPRLGGDTLYNCLAEAFYFLKYADIGVCKELALLKSKYGRIGITFKETIKLMKNYGVTEFVPILYNTHPDIGSIHPLTIMNDTLKLYLHHNEATLASLRATRGSILIWHYFVIWRQADDTFLAIDPQDNNIIDLNTYVIMNTNNFEKEYILDILTTTVDYRYVSDDKYRVTMDDVIELFVTPSVLATEPTSVLATEPSVLATEPSVLATEPTTFPSIQPIPELQEWNIRREVFGFPPLRYRPERLLFDNPSLGAAAD